MINCQVLKFIKRKSFIKLSIFSIFVMAIFFTFLTSEGLAVSKLTIRPMLVVSAQLDSNFYKTPDNEREVYTYLVQPGVQLGFESPKSKLELYYTLNANFFDDKNSVPEGQQPADEENYYGHIVHLDAVYSPWERLSLALNDQFNVSRRPVEADLFSNSVGREKYWVNRLTPGVFYNFNNRFELGLRYRRTDLNYSDSYDEDYIEHRGLANFTYNPTRSTTFELDYQRWTHDNKEDLIEREYTSDQLLLIAEKRFKHFSFDAGIGYHNRAYEQPGIEDQDVINWLASITAQNPSPPEQTRRIGRQFLRSKTHAFVAYEQNFNNLGYYYDLYVARRLTGSIGHVFWHKINTVIRGYYQNDDYKFDTSETESGSNEGREEDIYDISGKIGYLIKENLSVSFTAGYEERDSNLDIYDYENTYYMISLELNYDLASRGDFSKEASYYRK